MPLNVFDQAKDKDIHAVVAIIRHTHTHVMCICVMAEKCFGKSATNRERNEFLLNISISTSAPVSDYTFGRALK